MTNLDKFSGQRQDRSQGEKIVRWGHREMRERFDAPEGMIEKDVKHVIEELTKIGALEE